MIDKIKNFINNLPTRYYHQHAIFAVLSMVLLSFYNVDFAFGFSLCIYLSREITQWPYERFFDWKGLLYPTGALIVVRILIEMWK